MLVCPECQKEFPDSVFDGGCDKCFRNGRWVSLQHKEVEMISQRLQFLQVAALGGELLEVINAWTDDLEYGVDEIDRLRLVDMLTEWLEGRS